VIISRDCPPSPAVTARRARAVPQSRAAGEGYLLGLDAGTGSCRAALYTRDGLCTRDGQPAALAQREWSHPPAGGIPGSQSFDPAGNWALICACIRDVLGTVPSPAAVRAIGCSAMGGGLVLYGRGGQELWACANGDTRAEREAAVMLADGTAAELYRRGGGWISLGAAPRLAWVRGHEPEVWAAATRLSMIADWMVLRLTGTLATETSIGSTSGLFDLGRRAWSPELLDRCGLELALFPEVVEAGTVVGQVSAAASSQTGLAPGTPVVAGGLDTALGLTGLRPAAPGRFTVTGGSFWKQTVVAPAPAVEPAGRLRTICHVWPGQWLVEGISFYAGFALRWLRDRAAEARPAGGPAGRTLGYAKLEELAAAVPPGAGGLTARLVPADAWAWVRWQPPFPSPRPGAAPAGLGEQVRAIQEAAAYSTRRAAGLLSELLGPGALQEVILTGGAACGRLWPQILADVLGYQVGVPEHTESAARGAAILAGRAAGMLPEDPRPGSRPGSRPGPQPDDAGPAVPGLDRATRPNPAGQRAYDRLYARWQSAAPGSRGPA
jgi:autoinducer-2 kinase